MFIMKLTYFQRQSRSGFLPPGRPKKWRAMAMEVLKKSVAQRIEGTQVDERSSNKLWLVMYLEVSLQDRKSTNIDVARVYNM